MEGNCISAENGDPGMLTLISLETSCKWIPSGELIESDVAKTIRTQWGGFQALELVIYFTNEIKKAIILPTFMFYNV